MEQPYWFENKGQTVAATLHMPTAAQTVPAVIVCHGFTGNRIDGHRIFVNLSRELAERGIASLRFDYRGCGESTGDLISTTVTGYISDAMRAVEVLSQVEQVDSTRIGVVGLSLGGAVAACVAGRVPTIRSAVLWSPVAHIKEVVLATLGIDNAQKLRCQGRFDVGGEWLGLGFLEDAFEVRPLDEIAKSNASVLLVHGTGDEVVHPLESQAYERILERAGRRIERQLIEGADHCFCDCEQRLRVIGLTVQWLSDTL